MVLKEIQNVCKHKSEHFVNLPESEIQNRGMSCNLTDILLIKDLSLNIHSRKRNRNTVFPCEKMGITSMSPRRENAIQPN